MNKKSLRQGDLNPQKSLVDQVEDRILTYLQEQNFRIGDSLPKEMEFVERLGVARSVVREVLSRLRMMGLVETRTKRGMILSEPNLLGGVKRVLSPYYFRPSTLLDLLELRVSLEIGLCTQIIEIVTDDQIKQLTAVVESSILHQNKAYDLIDEFKFHTMLYEISQNRFIMELQLILHPVMNYVKEYYESELQAVNLRLTEAGQLVTHADLLEAIKSKDGNLFQMAMQRHFASYQTFIRKQRENNTINNP